MNRFTPFGEQAVQDLAARHGVSRDGIVHLLDALQRGHGTMAQFNHPDFGGSGQWMQGGMTMVSDLFNQALRMRVDAACADVAALLFQSQPLWEAAPAPTGSTGSVMSSDAWWPSSLQYPDGVGSQNGMRYAYFSQAHRLVVDVNGQVTVYDTLDHQIGGFGQAQSGSGTTMTLSSQYGQVDLRSLPVVGGNPPPLPTPVPVSMPVPTFTPEMSTSPAPSNAGSQDVLGLIERLAELRSRGVLSEAEFQTKKADLLQRL